MTREFKPGDVAIIEGYSGGPQVALVRKRREAVTGLLEFVYAVGGFDIVGELDGDVTARPLVVIDPEDREQVERLWQAWRDLAPDHRLAQANMQAALREFADPKPPKPDEPQGLGAVVEDADDQRWVRVYGGVPNPWRDSVGCIRCWDQIDAVTVLSEGVQ